MNDIYDLDRAEPGNHILLKTETERSHRTCISICLYCDIFVNIRLLDIFHSCPNMKKKPTRFK